MKALIALFLCVAGASALADGLIIVQHPGPLPPANRQPLRPPRHHTFAPLEIKFHRVDVAVEDQIAITEVDQEFYNPNDRRLEGTYIFPIPKGAQIDRFSMEVDGKEMEAELLPADQARKIYEDIVRRHRDPALLEYLGRDLFKVRIFPIEPRSPKRVKLSYTELLEADAGLVRYTYPLNTEKYSSKPISDVSLTLRLETSEPLNSIYSPSHEVEIRRRGNHEATVGFEASEVKPDKDFQLVFASDPTDIGVNLLTYRSGRDDGFFLLLAAPTLKVKNAKVLRKDVVFVLDTSGSMAGKKLSQAKAALRFCVANLNAEDRFELVRFSTEAEPLFDDLVTPTEENREEAEDFIDKLGAIGGTAIHAALSRAIELRPDGSGRPYYVIFLTDGRPTVGEVEIQTIIEDVAEAAEGKTRVFCFGIGHDVNTRLLDRITEETRAASAYVLPEEDIEVKVSSFFTKIKEPVLADVRLRFPEGIRVTKTYPSSLPDLFMGEQLVVAGRYSGEASGRLVLRGAVDGESRRKGYDITFPRKAKEHDFIPRLWATRRVGYLLDEIRLRGENRELREEVTQLAREYGIVTPYTAFLIHEDERSRNVPLAQQSLPQLETDRGAHRLSQSAFHSLATETSGQSAVAAARYGLANKNANQADSALTLSRLEAKRALVASQPISAPMPAPPTSTGGSRGGLAVDRIPAPTGMTMAPTAAARPRSRGTVSATADPALVADNLLNYTQQSRFVNGRTFYQNGAVWMDANVQKQKDAKPVRVRFNSDEYFDLLMKYEDVRPWLALGRNVQFVLNDTVYEIYE